MENDIQQPLHLRQQTDQLHSVSPTISYRPSTTFIILIVVLLILTVDAGGYILGAKQNKIVKNRTQPVVPIPKPSPTPVDETANWKTYTNRKYGYSMKYPPMWTIVGEKTDSSNTFFLKKDIRPALYPTISVAIVEKSPTFKDTMEKHLEIYKTGKDTSIKVEYVTVDNIQGYKFTQISYDFKFSRLSVEVENSNWHYDLTVTNTNKEEFANINDISVLMDHLIGEFLFL